MIDPEKEMALLSRSGGIEADALLHGFILIFFGIYLKGFVRIPQPDHVIARQVFHGRHFAEFTETIVPGLQLCCDVGGIPRIRTCSEKTGDVVDHSHRLVLFDLFLRHDPADLLRRHLKTQEISSFLCSGDQKIDQAGQAQDQGDPSETAKKERRKTLFHKLAVPAQQDQQEAG